MKKGTEKKLIKNKKKLAFVASGGAVKAACFHIGVMLAMERFGFSFLGGLKEDNPEIKAGQISVYVGSSAGSFITSLVAAGFKPNELFNSLSDNYNPNNSILRPIVYKDIIGNNIISNASTLVNALIRSTKFKNLSIEGIMHTFLGINGVFNTKNVGKYLEKVLPTKSFQDLAPELYAVTTDLNNPHRIILGTKKLKPSVPCSFATDVDIPNACVGSMSLPGIFGPHKLAIEGKEVHVFDGEIRKTMSTHIAKDAGADLVIASYTHQPYHYNSDYGSLINYGLPAILVQTIYQLVESRIVTSRDKHERKYEAIDEVEKFFDEKSLPKELKNELLEKMYKRLDYNPNLDYIYIAPEPNDSKMFFEDHFNLSLKSMGKIIRSGFKSAYHVLNNYDFDFANNNNLEIEFINSEDKNALA